MLDETTLLAMQQQMAQQAAFSQIPDVVKRVSVQTLYHRDCLPFVVHCSFSPSCARAKRA